MVDYYYRIMRKIMRIKNSTSNAKIVTLGFSNLGRKIKGLFFNFNKKETFIIHAGIHAREYYTTNFLINVAQKISKQNGKQLKNLPNMLFIFMVNPDGTMLVKNGLQSVKSYKIKQFLYSLNNKNANFKLFKANSRGVDLNNNFDADFGQDPRYKDSPGPHGYPGAFCFSEPEALALKNALENFKPIFTISLHTKGEEIYYNFKLKTEQIYAHKNLANIFAKKLNYKIVDDCGNSCAGFKDYCILKLKIPSITIEMVSDFYSYPLPKAAVCDIIKKVNNFIMAVEESYIYILKHKGEF